MNRRNRAPRARRRCVSQASDQPSEAPRAPLRSRDPRQLETTGWEPCFGQFDQSRRRVVPATRWLHDVVTERAPWNPSPVCDGPVRSRRPAWGADHLGQHESAERRPRPVSRRRETRGQFARLWSASGSLRETSDRTITNSAKPSSNCCEWRQGAGAGGRGQGAVVDIAALSALRSAPVEPSPGPVYRFEVP